MNVSNKNSCLISRFLIKKYFSQSVKNLKNYVFFYFFPYKLKRSKNLNQFLFLISFFTSSFFYSSLAFSDLNTREISECHPLPEITSTVVYQSVEAPQIEPLSEETDPYKDYYRIDLVESLFF